MEHHELVSINAPPHSEVCFDFKLGSMWGAHTYKRSPAMTGIPTQALTFACLPSAQPWSTIMLLACSRDDSRCAPYRKAYLLCGTPLFKSFIRIRLRRKNTVVPEQRFEPARGSMRNRDLQYAYSWLCALNLLYQCALGLTGVPHLVSINGC